MGHNKKINDACFSNDNKFVISCSLDCSLRIWDILSGNLINNIVIDKKPIISMDLSNDGEILATAFVNSKEINLWHNLIYMKPWTKGSHPQHI